MSPIASTVDISHGRWPIAAGAIAAGSFTLNIHPSREDWCAVEEWMVEEGWDPGFGDAHAVTALDPRALVIGMLDHTPISALSVMRVSDQYAFVGNFIVRRDFRERGFGLATWRAALPHAGSRTIGLEAVLEQVETYRRAGFSASHATVAYRGTISRERTLDRHVRLLQPGDCEAVTRLDALCAPHERADFLAAWFAAPGARTLVYDSEREMTGFGMIRPSRTGYRIGPLIATTPAAAKGLYDALTAPFPGEKVFLNSPDRNAVARELAECRGLERVGHTVRMYSQPVRPTALAHCYSIASLAWG